MDIDLNAEIEGVKLRYIRDALKKMNTYRITAEELARRLRVTDHKVRQLIEALCNAGYIEAADIPAGWQAYYETTVQGNALCMATMQKKLTRAQAEEILDKLRRRIEAINNDPQYLYVVMKVAVFGSYISGKAKLGDVDIAIDLQARPPLTMEQVIEQSIWRAERAGRARNFLAKLVYGENEVRRELQRVSRRLSIHSMSELEYLQLTSEVMFEE